MERRKPDAEFSAVRARFVKLCSKRFALIVGMLRASEGESAVQEWLRELESDGLNRLDESAAVKLAELYKLEQAPF